MAVSLGLLSLTQMKVSQQQHSNYNPEQREEGGTRSFDNETSNAAGTTWPPHSYTCTFCRREFRSAQALGGHMNVHRRDRARLHHTSVAAATSSTPNQHLVTTNGLCLLYSIPDSNDFLFSKAKRCFKSTSPYQKKKKLGSHLARRCAATPCDSTHTVHSSQSKKEVVIRELDLELRLGRGFH